MIRLIGVTLLAGRADSQVGGRTPGAGARAALAPFAGRLAPPSLERLANGMSLVLGIETWVTLRNVCGLERDRAEAIAVWTARTLVAQALAESEAGGR
jgi:hypothetical protein